jgi:hypothetical protein
MTDGIVTTLRLEGLPNVVDEGGESALGDWEYAPVMGGTFLHAGVYSMRKAGGRMAAVGEPLTGSGARAGRSSRLTLDGHGRAADGPSQRSRLASLAQRAHARQQAAHGLCSGPACVALPMRQRPSAARHAPSGPFPPSATRQARQEPRPRPAAVERGQSAPRPRPVSRSSSLTPRTVRAEAGPNLDGRWRTSAQNKRRSFVII